MLPSYLSAFAGALCIGWAPIFVRLADVSPSAIGVYRMGFAGLALVLVAWYLVPANMFRGKRGRMVAIAGFVCGTFYAADLILWHWSIRYTSVAKAALLANLAPVFVMCWISLTTRRLPSSGALIALLICLGGVALLLEINNFGSGAGNIGDLLGIATAVAYAGYIVGSARYGSTIPTPLLMASSCLFCVIALVPSTAVEVVQFDMRLVPETTSGWLPLLGLAFVVHCGGQGMIVHALRKVNPTHVSLILLLQPASAAVWSMMLFDEVLTTLQLAGMALVFLGLYFVLKDRSSSA